ncbi:MULTISPECIES: hypothetical protein [unclassified Mycobacterium]|uniref:hypothetical protein n=1 Tax=unclassified Mycobacterium TaxID=2642494 RepID=UPI0029C86ADF|nr:MULTISPECIES: hypothetical protein [unclassified Mycobacterium]
MTIACGGCSAEPETAQAVGDGKFDRSQYTIVWSDPAGLGLMSPEATFVRGSIESLDASAVNGRADAAAPGFWDSLTGTAKARARAFFEMGPTRTEFGVKRYEILDHADHGSSVTVTVCAYDQQVGHQLATDSYEFGSGGPYGTVITFDRAGATAPPGHLAGPETFTEEPVFGSWRTTGWQTGYFAAGDPCAGRPLPDVAPGSWHRTRGAGPYVTDQPPHARSSPGWPTR